MIRLHVSRLKTAFLLLEQRFLGDTYWWAYKKTTSLPHFTIPGHSQISLPFPSVVIRTSLADTCSFICQGKYAGFLSL